MHNHWEYKYKIENMYDLEKVPTFLKKIDTTIQQTANDLADINDGESSENLDHLAALFKFGKSGKSEAKDLYLMKFLNMN